MKKIWSKYKTLLFFGVFILPVYFCVPSSNYTDCKWNEDFNKLKFEGVIQKKYLDKSDHSVPKVVLKNFQNNLDTLYLFGEDTGIYESISLGDTIKKASGTRLILKMKNQKYVAYKTVEFGCDSVELRKEEYLFKLYDLLGNN
ncbi:hypothetical protein [Pontibacter flavimaris]|uniref:Uncharacterized protein n=1 Tax=Pontibacter flavimaris TaxID=1797110 RepID=A0A1Q5PCI4_9BACT|nr:hypothetical protein [Pontibacter flavimaris]OKL39907.1 hypothetical protein A3841_16160 [Pontibacter flavimaris]